MYGKIFNKVIAYTREVVGGGVPETQINCLINDRGALACTTTWAIDHIKIHNELQYKIHNTKYKIHNTQYKILRNNKYTESKQ